MVLIVYAGYHMAMQVQDSDRNSGAQRERDKQRQMEETRARFSGYSEKHLGTSTMKPKKFVSATKTGLIPMMIFWFAVMGFLYVLMTHYLKPKQAQVLANGDLVITRSHDGHFYTTGVINGAQARFLVDTGASLVSVSDKFAQKASIRGGVSTIFRTANGDRTGRIVGGVAVSVGPVTVTNINVGVGLHGGKDDDALLGQSFLSKFDITMGKNEMVLRAR